MKVLFVSNDPSIFDTESAARARMRQYAQAIAGDEGALHIISPAPVAFDGREGQLFLHGVTGNKFLLPFAIAKRAHALVLQEGIEIVSAQDPFEYGWAAARAVRGTHARLHIQVHTDFLSPWFIRGSIERAPSVPMPLLNRIRRHIAGQVLPSAHGIRAVSERVKNSMMRKYGTCIPLPSVIPVYVPSDVPEAVPLPEHDFTFTLITVGRLEPEKRIEDILSALARIHDRYPSVGLLIVGDGRERPRLEGMVRTLGLSGRVVFLGEQATTARGLMRSAQAYIQASAYEGYSRTLIEAALARIPIITTDVGIVGEVFLGYRDVLSAPPGDPAALAIHIVGLVEDIQARQLLVMSAETTARAHLASCGDPAHAIAADLARLLQKS